MSKRHVYSVAAMSMLAVICLVGMQQQETGNHTGGQSVQYARQQFELAQEGLRQIEQGIERGAVSPVDPQYATWSQRVVESHRAVGDPEGYASALQRHVERLERIVEARRTFRREGAVTDLQVLEAEYFLAEARHQLAQRRSAARNAGDRSRQTDSEQNR